MVVSEKKIQLCFVQKILTELLKNFSWTSINTICGLVSSKCPSCRVVLHQVRSTSYWNSLYPPLSVLGPRFNLCLYFLVLPYTERYLEPQQGVDPSLLAAQLEGRS